MKPANLTETKKSRGAARVKMLIRAHLYWFQGFPVLENGSLSWCCPFSTEPDKRIVNITVKHISKAARTINELQREYPKALPQVVGNVTAWARQSKQYLDHVKELFEFLRSTDGNTVFSLFDVDRTYGQSLTKIQYSRHDDLNLIFSALSWLYFTQRESIKPAFHFFSNSSSELTTISEKNLVTAIELINLGVVEPGRVDDLVRLVANFDDVAVATIGVNHYVRPFSTIKITTKKLNKKDLSDREKPSVMKSDVVFEFVDWLFRLKSNKRRRALQLLNILDLNGYIGEWNRWWNRANPLIKKITNNAKYLTEQKYEAVHSLQDDLARLLNTTPSELNLEYLFASIRYVSSSDELGPSALNIITACSELPTKQPQASKMLCHIHLIHHDYEQDVRLLSAYFDALAKYFRKCTNPKRLEPWENLDRFYSTPESGLLETLDKRKAPIFFNVLYELNDSVFRSVSSDELAPLAFFVAEGIKNEKVVKFSAHLLEAELLSDVDEIVAKVFASLDVDGVAAEKLVRLYRNTDSNLRDEHILSVCLKVFIDNNQIDLFKEIIDLDMFKGMVHSCYQMYVIQKIDGVERVPSIKPVIAKYDEWIGVYPEELKSTLVELNGLVDNAESKANKISSKIWRPKHLLLAELDTIRSQLDRIPESQRANLEKRANNFQSRVNNHKPITPPEVSKIKEKVTHLIAVQRLQLWKDKIYQQFKECWAKYFGFDPLNGPDWLYSDDMVAKLLPIVDLDKGPRNLAIRIIKNRGDKPPWDFRSEAKNIQFREKIKAKRIDIDKWVDGIGSRTYQACKTTQIHIDISKDPLDTINMGGHFKTCLSPGNFNFFSVFANIADINKQVLYGKNDAGKVIGRVLVGMTDSGGIKVFHRYSHDRNDKFDEFVLEYINEWAREIGAILVQSGKIQKLVAPDWYDDGSINIDSGIKCLEAESSLRNSIPSMPSKEILSELKRQLAPLPINELTFPMIIQLEEIQGKHELVSDLVGIAKNIVHLDENTIVQLFKLSLSHDCGEYCFNFFNKVLKRVLDHQAINNYWVDEELALGIVQYDPVGILRIFNKVRRSKNFYLSTALKSSAIEALIALGRPKCVFRSS